MPRRRRSEEPTQHDPISDDRLQGFLNELDTAEEDVAAERERVKEVLDAAKAVGLNSKAMKNALRLSKRGAAEQNDYLATFSRCCELLHVGVQRELFNEGRPSPGEDPDNVIDLPPQ